MKTYEKFLNQLKKFRELKEEHLEGLELNEDSLRWCKRFLYLHPNYKPPQFSTTPNGNTVAQWRRDKDSDLIIEFLPDFTLYFILVYPEDFKTTMTFCGCCTFETFKKIMKPFNLYWVKK